MYFPLGNYALCCREWKITGNPKKRGKKWDLIQLKKYKKKQKNCLHIEFNRKVLVVVWQQKAVYTSIDCAGTVGEPSSEVSLSTFFWLYTNIYWFHVTIPNLIFRVPFWNRLKASGMSWICRAVMIWLSNIVRLCRVILPIWISRGMYPITSALYSIRVKTPRIWFEKLSLCLVKHIEN